VYVSQDGGHDTYFVQHVMLDLQQHYRERNMTFNNWFINTDGAASHFKSRFTFQSIFNFKKLAGALHVMWETCAPGHGKGPWDGIGAVVKRMLRGLEIKDKVYNRGAFDCYNVLAASADTWTAKIGSKVMLDKFVYHYVPVAGESVEGAVLPANVLEPIKRPKQKPIVTYIKGTRSNFCFDFKGDNKVRLRPLSCHCAECLERKWTECATAKTNPWTTVSVFSEQPSAGATSLKSVKAKLSDQRRSAARSTQPGEIVALESANDAEGFGFWLAEVVEAATYNHATKTSVDKGVKIVKGNYYMLVKIMNRVAVDSASTFILEATEETRRINAEGLILRNVKAIPVVNQSRPRTRSGKELAEDRGFELGEDELGRCTDAAEERLDAEGGSKHFEVDKAEPMLARNRPG
jgi:hypothetical protein